MILPVAVGNHMLTLRNAAENASVVPITDDQIVAALRGDGGHGSHLRAIFGDVSLPALAEAGRDNGIALSTILAAYEDARQRAAAANPELDEAIDELRKAVPEGAATTTPPVRGGESARRPPVGRGAPVRDPGPGAALERAETRLATRRGGLAVARSKGPGRRTEGTSPTDRRTAGHASAWEPRAHRMDSPEDE